MQPEHLHLLINHFPIHGLFIATLVLLIGLWTGERRTQIAGLVVVLLSSLSIPFVMGSGEAALERYQDEDVIRSTLTEAGLDYGQQHYDAAEKGAKLTYLLLILSALALLSLKFKPLWFGKLAWVVLIMSVFCLLANAWIASSGGKIRRPDFQTARSAVMVVEPISLETV
ncbi:MAG: hypothetical protein ABQ298_09210 [Puniceicoccaceae bacterium]